MKQAIEQKNTEGARIYAQNVIREKNQALTYLRLGNAIIILTIESTAAYTYICVFTGSRIDAVSARLETAIRMQDVSQAMGQTVQGNL